MDLTPAPYERIAPYLPVQRGHVSHANLQVLNAILDVAEQGWQWRGLPARCGNWPPRMHRWMQNGVLAWGFEHLQRERLGRSKLKTLALDSTIVKVRPAGDGGAPEERSPSPRPVPRRLDRQAASGGRGCTDRPVVRALAGPEGHQLLHRLGRRPGSPALIRDRAYAGGETRQLASALGCEPVGPPLRTRVAPWEYDRELDQRRHASGRLLLRWQGFRRSFSRCEKLDMVFLGFIVFALIVDALR